MCCTGICSLRICFSRIVWCNRSNPDNDAEIKIADFGLATFFDPDVAERLKCGSPGYVAPEVLNGLGYGAKADVFSAGVILCIILTGISPFYATTPQEMLRRNKEEDVDFSQQHWNYVSEEARALAKRMVARDPKDRCTAAEALQHPWFTSAHKKPNSLSNAQENMKKYREADRFDVSRIKPEFSMLTCTPLLKSRFEGKGSPLLVPLSDKREGMRFRCQTPIVRSRVITLQRNAPERVSKTMKKLKELAAKENLSNAVLDTSGNFDEKDMAENLGGEEEKNERLSHCEFTVRKFSGRATPSPNPMSKKSLKYLKFTATPVQNRREFKDGSSGGEYLQKIACTRLAEDTKTLPVPKYSHNLCTSELGSVRSINEQPLKANSTRPSLFSDSEGRAMNRRQPKPRSQQKHSVKLVSKQLLD
eukprot:TRINITY_DN8201_c0_g1_i2.p1 TRINITY_DN8201_c0_g1~~TRINITY_DN8201_c0_g1_i2.p1  ORF type:complete len:419 (+),score=111.28 TRINITY_DN8201_c0_g1_i2:838-2094(+)